jgi:hypothetical protein
MKTNKYLEMVMESLVELIVEEKTTVDRMSRRVREVIIWDAFKFPERNEVNMKTELLDGRVCEDRSE